MDPITLETVQLVKTEDQFTKLYYYLENGQVIAKLEKDQVHGFT